MVGPPNLQNFSIRLEQTRWAGNYPVSASAMTGVVGSMLQTISAAYKPGIMLSDVFGVTQGGHT